MKKNLFVAVALASALLTGCEFEDMGGTATSPTFTGSSTSNVKKTPTAPAPACNTQFNFFDEVFRLANNERTKAGLNPVMLATELIQSAQSHTDDMAKNNYFSHTGLDGSTPPERAVGFGYNSYAYENLAAGYATPEEVVKGWMNSTKGHRENILNPTHTEVGIGFSTSKTSQYSTYWAIIYGNRLDEDKTPAPKSAMPENLGKTCIEVEPDQTSVVKAWTPESDLIAGLSVNPHYTESAVSTPEPAVFASLLLTGIGLLASGRNRSGRGDR